jgi:hypothetical protein
MDLSTFATTTSGAEITTLPLNAPKATRRSDPKMHTQPAVPQAFRAETESAPKADHPAASLFYLHSFSAAAALTEAASVAADHRPIPGPIGDAWADALDAVRDLMDGLARLEEAAKTWLAVDCNDGACPVCRGRKGFHGIGCPKYSVRLLSIPQADGAEC